MSMKMMNAAYLVDNVALLSLQEKQEGVEFHCFDMDRKVQIAEEHLSWSLEVKNEHENDECSLFGG
jgi:hypothetical protein